MSRLLLKKISQFWGISTLGDQRNEEERRQKQQLVTLEMKFRKCRILKAKRKSALGGMNNTK